MITVITTQKIKPDNKYNNAVDEVIKSCQEIQATCTDEKLIAVATKIIEELDKLEEYYAD